MWARWHGLSVAKRRKLLDGTLDLDTTLEKLGAVAARFLSAVKVRLDVALAVAIAFEGFTSRNALVEIVWVLLAIAALLFGTVGLQLAHLIALLALGAIASKARQEREQNKTMSEIPHAGPW